MLNAGWKSNCSARKSNLPETAGNKRTYLELIELRFRNSLSTALDVFQQRETVARTKALIPPVESQEQLKLHELAYLLGRPAGAIDVATADFPDLPDLPGLGIPLDLLSMRPDVRAAGLNLQSADWSVSAARPTVCLP